MSSRDALNIDHSGMLSSATLKALELSKQPFRSLESLADAESSDPSGTDLSPYYFSDPTTAEQLADIKQALITGDDLLLILGEHGAGKSTMLKQLEANSGLRIQCFPVLDSERFSTLNLFTGMLEAFKVEPPDKFKDMLDELIPYLQQLASKNTLSTVLLDDAHAVNQTELTQLLSGMLYINSQDETLMRVALAATPDFEERIPDLLPEGADLPYSNMIIDGLSPQRAAAYLGHRLQLAGFDGEFPFTERDMASLVEHSAGLPAELHKLTADVLNEKHGRIEDSLPPELLGTGAGGFLQSNMGKLLLGTLASLLIVGGLLMFLPGSDQDNGLPSSEGNANELKTEELKLIEEDDQAANTLPEDSNVNAPTLSAASTTDQSQASSAATQSQTEASNSQSSAAPSERSNQSATAQTTTAQTNSASAASSNQNTNQITTVENSEAATLQATQQNVPTDTANADPNAQTDAQTDAPLIDNTAQNDTALQQPADNLTAPSESNSSVGDASGTGNNNATTQVAAQSEPGAETATVAGNTASTTSGTAAIEAPGNASNAAQVEPLASLQTNELPSNPEDQDLAQRLESPSWILLQLPGQYTIQMSASRERASVEDFLRQNALPAPNSIFSFERDGVLWFALVHGIFESIDDAREAVERMPEAALRDQPWIRSISRIQAVLDGR
ncbi:MAG: AAA family ATPase [Granulosicoccus sp.]|nr:AAA family ATPase [Granulosicoccus sp.]